MIGAETSWESVLQGMIAEEMFSGEEVAREDVSNCLIREHCDKSSEVQSLVERYHTDKAVASRIINIFSDNAISRFRNILKRRQKQNSLEKLLLVTEAQ